MDITQIRHAGFDWNVRIDASWLDVNIITSVIDNDEYGLLQMRRGLGNKVKTILDVGGHIGSFGVFAKSLWPDAKLIAVEPEVNNCKLYRMNLELNGFYGNIMQAAIGYDANCNCLVHAPSTTGGAIMRTKEEAQKYIDEGYRFYNRIDDDDVAILTVEDIIKAHNIDKIDIAKWDCEGGEIDALKNMDEETADKFVYMMGEYHIWNENSGYLKSPLWENKRFWRNVRRKFKNHNFCYMGDYGRLGLFQAWPKKAS